MDTPPVPIGVGGGGPVVVVVVVVDPLNCDNNDTGTTPPGFSSSSPELEVVLLLPPSLSPSPRFWLTSPPNAFFSSSALILPAPEEAPAPALPSPVGVFVVPPGTRTVGDGLLLGPPTAVVDTDTRLIPEDSSSAEDLWTRPPPPPTVVVVVADADLGVFIPLVVDLGGFAPLAAAVLDAVLPPAPMVGEPVAPRVEGGRFEEDGVFVAGVRVLVTPTLTEPRAAGDGDGDDDEVVVVVNLREEEEEEEDVVAVITDDARLVVVVGVVPVTEPPPLNNLDDDDGANDEEEEDAPPAVFAIFFAPVDEEGGEDNDDDDDDATDFVRIVRVPTDNGMSLPLKGSAPL